MLLYRPAPAGKQGQPGQQTEQEQQAQQEQRSALKVRAVQLALYGSAHHAVTARPAAAFAHPPQRLHKQGTVLAAAAAGVIAGGGGAQRRALLLVALAPPERRGSRALQQGRQRGGRAGSRHRWQRDGSRVGRAPCRPPRQRGPRLELQESEPQTRSRRTGWRRPARPCCCAGTTAASYMLHPASFSSCCRSQRLLWQWQSSGVQPPRRHLDPLLKAPTKAFCCQNQKGHTNAQQAAHLLSFHHVVLRGHQSAALAAAVRPGRTAVAVSGAALLRLAQRRGIQAAGFVVLLCGLRAAGEEEQVAGYGSAMLVAGFGWGVAQAQLHHAAPAQQQHPPAPAGSACKAHTTRPGGSP